MFKYLLYQIEYRRWLFLALLLALLVHALPALPGLAPEGKSVLAIVLLVIFLVIFEPVPLPVLSFLVLILLVFFEVAPPAQIMQSFMSDAVVFIAGSLMLAVAAVKQQLDKRILFFILRMTRASLYGTLFSIVVLSSLLASVMGEHAVAAIMLPVALTVIRSSQRREGSGGEAQVVLLMAVAYGCAMASVGSPSGGARNAVMLGYWERLSSLQVSYLDWMLLLYPLVLVQIPILYLLLRRVYRPQQVMLRQAYRFLYQEMKTHKKLRPEDWVTISILLLTLLLWILFSKELGLGPIALLGVLLCLVTGVLTWEDVNQNLNWGVIILLSSVIAIGLWMDATGAAAWIAEGTHSLLGFLHAGGGFPLILFTSLAGTAVGAVLSSGPAIAILGPVVLQQAELAGESPIVLGLVLVVSATYANFTPMSSPACTIVYGSGMVPRRDYFRVGWRLSLLSLGLILALALMYWPLMARFV